MKLQDLFENNSSFAQIIKNGYEINFRKMVEGKAPALFRGIDLADIHVRHGLAKDTNVEYFETPYSTKRRQSTSGSNFILNYITMTDLSVPEWESIPDRTTSTFCSTIIPGFGDTTFVIIPSDDVQVYAACEDDFNYLKFPASRVNLLEFRDLKNYLQDMRAGGAFKYDAGLLYDLDTEYYRMYKRIQDKVNDPLIKRILVNGERFNEDQFEYLVKTLQEILDIEDEIPTDKRLDINDDIDMTVSALIRMYFCGRSDIKIADAFKQFIPDNIGIEDFAGPNAIDKLKTLGQGGHEIWFRGSYLGIKLSSEDTKHTSNPEYFLQSDKFQQILKQL